MKSILRSILTTALALAVASSVLLGAPIRVVNCNEAVPSKKRGICMNNMSAADFRALAPGVTWFYNWHFKTDSLPPAGVKMTFIPMVWGNRPDALAALPAILAGANPKPPVVFAINEPNLKGQAFIPPQTTAELFKKVAAIAAPFNVPVVGPHMAIGSGADSSIKAMDPLTNKVETYTFMVPFLRAFFHYLGATKVAAIGVHSYGNIGELKWAAGAVVKEFKRPVWVTEYAQWNVKNVEEARDYLIQATDFLEQSPDVQGYAWFKERANDNPKISLFERTSGKLSILGEAYVNLPTHDSDLYYRIPGKLSAAKFVRATGMEIKSTRDKEGFFDLSINGGAASAQYNLQVDAAGEVTVKIRAAGDGKINLQSGSTPLGSVQLAKKTGWQEAEAKITLPAGTQTIRMSTEGLVLRIHSLEFVQ